MSDVFSGSKNDFAVCKIMITKYTEFLTKDQNDFKLNDPDVNADSWAVMADKTYIRLESTLYCIILYKASRSQLLTVTQYTINKHISSVYIIAENFYRCKHHLF